MFSLFPFAGTWARKCLCATAHQDTWEKPARFPARRKRTKVSYSHCLPSVTAVPPREKAINCLLPFHWSVRTVIKATKLTVKEGGNLGLLARALFYVYFDNKHRVLGDDKLFHFNSAVGE